MSSGPTWQTRLAEFLTDRLTEWPLNQNDAVLLQRRLSFGFGHIVRLHAQTDIISK